MQRPWDPENKYISTVVKEYKNWILEVSCKQHTLGSLILFLKRETDPISLSQLSNEELLELRSITNEIEKAFAQSNLFKPNQINYLQLGNNLKWLHIHCVPRYAEKRIFENEEWIDTTFGHILIWKKEGASKKLLVDITKAIKPLFD